MLIFFHWPPMRLLARNLKLMAQQCWFNTDGTHEIGTTNFRNRLEFLSNVVRKRLGWIAKPILFHYSCPSNSAVHVSMKMPRHYNVSSPLRFNFLSREKKQTNTKMHQFRHEVSSLSISFCLSFGSVWQIIDEELKHTHNYYVVSA